MLKIMQNIVDERRSQGFPHTRLMYVHVVEYGKH